MKMSLIFLMVSTLAVPLLLNPQSPEENQGTVSLVWGECKKCTEVWTIASECSCMKNVLFGIQEGLNKIVARKLRNIWRFLTWSTCRLPHAVCKFCTNGDHFNNFVTTYSKVFNSDDLPICTNSLSLSLLCRRLFNEPKERYWRNFQEMWHVIPHGQPFLTQWCAFTQWHDETLSSFALSIGAIDWGILSTLWACSTLITCLWIWCSGLQTNNQQKFCDS